MECVRLRVKDIDFGYARITVRDAKSERDRITMLPVNVTAPFCRIKQFDEAEIACCSV
jgi:integrase